MLFVDGEQVERACAVFCARPGVDPGRFQAGVAEELGDDHEVGAAAHERRREGVPEGVLVPTSEQAALSSPVGVSVSDPPALAFAVADMYATKRLAAASGTR